LDAYSKSTKVILMDQFEYIYQMYEWAQPSSIQERLNKLGKNGWELVQYIDHNKAPYFTLIMKRKISSPENIYMDCVVNTTPVL